MRGIIIRTATKTYNLLPKFVRDFIGGTAFYRIVLNLLSGTRNFVGDEYQLTPAAKTNDLSWEQFESQILAHRDSYLGVYIQEPVIPWSISLYQRPQHMATAMGDLGYLVIYLTTLWRNDFGGDHDLTGVRQVSKNVWLTHLQNPLDIKGAIRSTYSTVVAPIIARPNQKVIYEYVDHIDEQISGKGIITALEDKKRHALSGRADLIVSTANKLHQEIEEAHSSVPRILIPNAVDFEFYQKKKTEVEVPESIQKFRNRYEIVVGYFGAIAPWLWTDLINELTTKRKDVGFIFVGPDYGGAIEKIKKNENVMLTGAVNYENLTNYAHSFDVTIIPFYPGEIAETTSPLKLFEYFALQKPVVVTSAMRECVQFEGVFPAGDLKSFSQAIDDAFSANKNPKFSKRILANAKANSWLARASELHDKIKDLKW